MSVAQPTLALGGGTNSSSATFANPLSTNNAWNSSIDPAIHNALGLNGQDLSQGQFTGNAYASGPNQNYSSATTGGSSSAATNTSYGPTPGATGALPSQFNQPGGFGNPNSPDLSNQYKQGLYSQYQNWLHSQQSAAASNAQSQIEAITNAYNQYRGLLENQRPGIVDAYNTGLADLNNQLQLGQQQGQANSSQLTSSYNAGMGQLGQQNQRAIAQNREIARAVGGNGSDYAQLQNQTANAYNNNQFAATNDYQSRLNQIQQGMQSLQQWGAAQQHDLATQYNKSISDLALNESLSDYQKLQNVNQIQSDYQKNLADINNQVTAFGNQLALAQAQVQQTALMFGKSLSGYNPLTDMASNMFQAASNTQAPTVDTSGGISYPNNKTAGGINTNNNNAAGY